MHVRLRGHRVGLFDFVVSLHGLPSINRDGGLVTYRISFVAARDFGTARRAVLVSSTVLLVASAFGHSAKAQVMELEGITIYSANRTPTDASKVGSTVEVLTEKDLAKQSRTYLKDYLETLPGVNFSQFGPPGTQAGISIRGASGRYVKLLVDGMDLSDPSGVTTETAFEHLLVGDVSRIELVKGSQSTLYGGDAVAGVINIETKKATKPGFSQGGGVEYGAYNTFRGAYTAGYAANDGSNISVAAQGVDTDGFSAAAVGTEDDGYRNLTFSGRGEYYLTPSAKVFFSARTLDADLDIDGGFPFNDNADTVDVVQHAGRVGAEVSFLDGAFRNTVALQGMRNEREYFGSSAGSYVGERVKAEYQGVVTLNERLSLLGGVDWEKTTADSYSVNGQSADWTGYFAQLMIEPIDGLVLTGGGRLDSHSNFGDFKTHRLTGAYLFPGSATKIRGSYGTGFRVPSLDELFGEFPLYASYSEYGNPNLEPETSKTWDAGIDQGFLDGRVQLGVTYFELDTDNLISTEYNPGTGKYKYTNIPGVTRRNGVELTSAVMIVPGVTVSASYTYVDTETASGARLNHVPKNNVVLGVDLAPMEKVALNVTAKGVTDTLGSGGVELDDYVLVSAKASYELLPGVEAYVRGENLLNEDYQTYVGYGTAGLSVYGGLKMPLPRN